MTVSGRNVGGLLRFATAWALLLVLARLVILSLHGQLPLPAYLPGLVLSLPAEFLFGLVAGWSLLGACRSPACRGITFLLIACIVAVKLGAFHYEAVFNRLPAVQLLFYVGELRGLASSLDANFPLAEVTAELVVILLALEWIRRRHEAREEGARLPVLHAGIAGLLLAVAILVNTAQGAIPSGARAASREPLIALLQSAFVRETYDLDQLHLTQRDFDHFLALNGNGTPGPVLDPRYPLCRLRADVDNPPAATPGRSLIVLILESVGQRELTETFRGEPLMPNLARIAGEHLAFTRAHAPGIKSIQTLTALFSALPPNPFNYYLWQTPLPDFDGWPRQLAERGYDTIYLHGGDLSFERQRPYVQAVGFRDIRELDSASGLPTHGWGYDDATMFRRLREVIEGRAPDAPPYLATLFTLSTHDPYLVPPEWPPVFSPVARQLREPGKCCVVIGEADTSVALAEAYRFLDAQVGAFHDWYQSLEPRPLLLILGDHAPYVLKQGSVARDSRLRFDIPVILAGLDADERARLAPHRDALLSVHDLPLLLSRLLGLPPHPCFMGADLAAPGAVPGVAYAIGPESLQYVHLWRGEREFVLDRAANAVSVMDGEGAALSETDARWVREFTTATFPVHYYLLEKNAYFPRRVDPVPALPDVTMPLFAAHRGNVDGPRDPGVENSRAALEHAAASAIDWLEIDVQLTADAVPVLSHDATLPGDPAVAIRSLGLAELRAYPAGAQMLTLEEALRDFLPRKKLLIELKPQALLQEQQRLVQEVALLLHRYDARGRVILDSFDEFLAASIRRQCDCETGLDMPYRKPVSDADLRHVRNLGLDWIYVEQSVVNADLVRRAHAAGIRVMAYTVNDPAVVAAWRRAGALPDGIITDHVSLAAQH